MSNPDSISQLLQRYYWYEIKKLAKTGSAKNPSQSSNNQNTQSVIFGTKDKDTK